MIKINYDGRFGNHLFQYGAAILLASKFDQKIDNPLNTELTYFNNIGREENFGNQIEVNDQNFEEVFSQDSLDSDIHLNGFFQSPFIVNLFNNSRKVFYSPQFENSGVYVHVRLGDLYMAHAKTGNRYQPLEYYQKAIGETRGGFISSDSPEDPMIKALMEEFDLDFFGGGEEDTIIFASSFQKRVLSLGTFSWWIGFLGSQDGVVCPDVNNHPIWHGEIFPQAGWTVISDYAA